MSRNYEMPNDMRKRFEQKNRARKRQIRIRVLSFALLFLAIIAGVLYKLNIIPHQYYYNSHFGIVTYKSEVD